MGASYPNQQALLLYKGLPNHGYLLGNGSSVTDQKNANGFRKANALRLPWNHLHQRALHKNNRRDYQSVLPNKTKLHSMNHNSESNATEWVAQWRRGDEQAAQKLYDQYAERLARLAASNMEARLKRRLSEDDIVQSVFHSFFNRTADQRISIENSRELWNLLVTMTLAKTRSAGRHHRALKRTVAAEVASTESDWLPDALAEGPSPSEALIFVETVEQITKDLPPKHREILALRMAGNARTEIARITGLSRQTIYRVLQLIEQRITEIHED